MARGHSLGTPWYRNLMSAGVAGAAYLAGRSKALPIPKKRKVAKAAVAAKSERVVTQQHDYSTQYKKRRMPRRRRRQWRRFVKKVDAVGQKLLGLRTVLNNDNFNIDIPGTSQNFGVFHLYGSRGTNYTREQGSADLLEIFLKDPDLISSAGYANLGTVQFRSATIDITMTNIGIDLLEVDVYKIKYGPGEKAYNGWTQAITEFNGTQTSIDGSANTIELTDRGATPFHVGGLMGILKAKVLWKKKFLIGSNQSSFFQHRDAGNHYVTISDISEVDKDFTHKNLTTTYLFVAKAPAAGSETVNYLKVAASRTYTYKVLARAQVQRKTLVL